MMEYLLSTFSFGDVITIASWIAGGVTFAVGSYYAFKYALKNTTERQDALQSDLRKLSEAIEKFTGEAREEIQATNKRVDALADRTSRIEERQAFTEGLLGKLDQRIEFHLRDMRERIDQILLRLGKD